MYAVFCCQAKEGVESGALPRAQCSLATYIWLKLIAGRWSVTHLGPVRLRLMMPFEKVTFYFIVFYLLLSPGKVVVLLNYVDQSSWRQNKNVS